MFSPNTEKQIKSIMQKNLYRWFVVLLSFLLGGCISFVTGLDPATRGSGQSETDATTSWYGGVHRIVVAYNDETANEGKIDYDPNNRIVRRGASLMGWSYSEDYGATWKYGGKVTPPQGWSVLWGDPAITTSGANYGLVFMSNLAFPESKFVSGQVSGYVYSAVGGACIARSTNGGVTFANVQCVTNTDPVPGKSETTNGHFYDGGSMASSPSGEIYAAFVDIDTSQIDIWRSPDGNQPFTKIPTPFPDYYVGSHPRIRVGRDGTLFVMAVAKFSRTDDSRFPFYVVASRFRDGRWSFPTVVTGTVPPNETLDFGASVLGAPLNMRVGPQFSFDIGTASLDRDDSIRFLVTQANSRGWYFVRGGLCDYALKSCGWYEGWTFGNAAPSERDQQRLDVFNPNVAAFPGFIFGIAPRWQGAFLTRYGNSTTDINVTRATLGYLNGLPFSIPIDIARDLFVCSDRRGYWGDYDGFLPIQVNGDSVRFMRFVTNSSMGCTKRWLFLGETQHVGAVDYTY